MTNSLQIKLADFGLSIHSLYEVANTRYGNGQQFNTLIIVSQPMTTLTAKFLSDFPFSASCNSLCRPYQTYHAFYFTQPFIGSEVVNMLGFCMAQAGHHRLPCARDPGLPCQGPST